MHLVPSSFVERIGEYDAWFDTPEGATIFATEVAAIRRALPGLEKPWLEIGVGSGRFAQVLGIEVGLDPSLPALALAKDKGIQVVEGKGEDLPFADGSFGAVFLITTLCFLTAPLVVLREARRVLKPGGGLLLAFLPRESPWGQVYETLKKEGHPFYAVANFFSVNEVMVLLNQAEFLPTMMVSTLCQPPGEVKQEEEPREGFEPGAGFVVIKSLRRY